MTPTKVSHTLCDRRYYSKFVSHEAVGGGAIPFNTQFFHDDDFDDGAGFDDAFDGEGGDPAAGVESGLSRS